MVARTFNLMLERAGKPPCFEYICAGGDPALFLSREAPEDSWKAGEHAAGLRGLGMFAAR